MVSHPGPWLGWLFGGVLSAAVVTGPGAGASGTDSVGHEAAALPVLEFAQATVDLGVIGEGGTSEAVVALHNGGQVAVDGLGLTVDPAGGPFSVAGVGPGCADGVLAPGGWCGITVGFSPVGPPGDFVATLRAAGRLAGESPVEATTRLDGSATTLVAWPIGFAETMSSGSLALTRDDATTWVHAHFIGADAGFGGFGRSRDGGRSWRSVRRMSDQGGRLAASGRFVHVVTNRACGLALRRNHNHGALGAWERARCIATPRSDGDRSRVDAAGRKVYVVSQRHETGRAVIRTSRDRGVTWRRIVVADAGADDWSVDVAAAGALAVVTWSADGATWARVSVDGGRHWRRAVRIATGRPSSADARGPRLVLAGTLDGVLWLRQWEPGTGWREVAAPPVGLDSLGSPAEASAPIVALGAAGVIGLAYRLDRTGTRTTWECVWAVATPGGDWEAPLQAPRDPGASARCHDAMWRPGGRPIVLASARMPLGEEAGPIAIVALP